MLARIAFRAWMPENNMRLSSSRETIASAKNRTRTMLKRVETTGFVALGQPTFCVLFIDPDCIWSASLEPRPTIGSPQRQVHAGKSPLTPKVKMLLNVQPVLEPFHH